LVDGTVTVPEMTPVIFTRYHRKGLRFTQNTKANERVSKLNRRLLDVLAGQRPEILFFMGRMGFGPAPRARSTRKSISSLIGNGTV
jgi:hypothetical protein